MKNINLIKNEVERIQAMDRMRDHYSAYAYYLKLGKIAWAVRCAECHNHLLKRLGGVSKNKGENYLTLGFSRSEAK